MTIPVSGQSSGSFRGGEEGVVCPNRRNSSCKYSLGGSDEGANEGEIRFCLAESAVGRGVPQERNDDKAWKPRVPSRQSGCPN